jgi:hypothetical protein
VAGADRDEDPTSAERPGQRIGPAVGAPEEQILGEDRCPVRHLLDQLGELPLGVRARVGVDDAAQLAARPLG